MNKRNRITNLATESMDRTNSTINYYDLHSTEYCLATRSLDMSVYWNRLALSLEAGNSILDVGCGSGRDLVKLAELGYQMTGVDLSRELALEASAYSDRPVIIADFSSMPFATGSFDAAWSIASLLHVAPDDIENVLVEIRRCLRPRGIFLSVVREGKGEHFDSTGRYFKYYSSSEWVAEIEAAGFEVLSLFLDIDSSGRSANGKHPMKWICSLAISQ